VTLTCKITKPDGKVKWFKNGKEIKPKDKKYEIVKDKKTQSLIIHGVTPDDHAEYSCQYEEDTTSCNLLVEGIV
jgi:CRISPR/Cas system-associated endonuclease/helicase Cas3